jgi:hypothetical protein
MHIPTHIISGWCVGATLSTTPRERIACMMAASLADLDGAGIVFGQEHYQRWHHVFGHNVFYGIVLAGLCSRLAHSGRRAWVFVLCLALFHLHLVMDYYGSGQGWGIHYLWPVSDWLWINPNAWSLGAWQNYLALGAGVLWTIFLAVWKGCTPFELVAPGLESDWQRLRKHLTPNSRS